MDKRVAVQISQRSALYRAALNGHLADNPTHPLGEHAGANARVVGPANGNPAQNLIHRFGLDYLIGFVLVGVAGIVDWHISAAPLVALNFALWLMVRNGRAGPAWGACLATLAVLAWRLPPEGSFGIDPEWMPRFLGNAAVMLMMLTCRNRTVRPLTRWVRRSVSECGARTIAIGAPFH